ncbi:hypothetical protein KCTCHS21_07550 [Cohnella abietis]|uniref:Uncharacterized protein n=1 Tax=Cohnella abietis TaxID=2507935 RepID=A0A3T1CZT7_9BACL|nr:hypothetical protein KCTCHS21_07550 [Cohnella abietis]
MHTITKDAPQTIPNEAAVIAVTPELKAIVSTVTPKVAPTAITTIANTLPIEEDNIVRIVTITATVASTPANPVKSIVIAYSSKFDSFTRFD